MKSMILSQVAKVSSIFVLLLLSSCYTPSTELASFPPRAKILDYTSKPVQSYNKTNKTYVITFEYMNNSLMNQLYIDEILKWKRDNGVK